jgi:hypothetical protein
MAMMPKLQGEMGGGALRKAKAMYNTMASETTTRLAIALAAIVLDTAEPNLSLVFAGRHQLHVLEAKARGGLIDPGLRYITAHHRQLSRIKINAKPKTIEQQRDHARHNHDERYGVPPPPFANQVHATSSGTVTPYHFGLRPHR